ncbi:MAG TPA: hypothetical protein VF228_19850 [Iamia sp.]
MDGHRRWIALIVASVAAVGALGLVATQLELSGAKDLPCGTALRIDLRGPTQLRVRATDLQGASDDPDALHDSGLTAEELLAEADEMDDRCKDRQRLALLGLGAGGALAVAAIALASYRLGRRAGRRAGS